MVLGCLEEQVARYRSEPRRAPGGVLRPVGGQQVAVAHRFMTRGVFKQADEDHGRGYTA
jgi:hypothetical protein